MKPQIHQEWATGPRAEATTTMRRMIDSAVKLNVDCMVESVPTDIMDTITLFNEIVTHYKAKMETLYTLQEEALKQPKEQQEALGGKLREARGTLVEGMIDVICAKLGIESRVGDTDLQEIRVEADGVVHTMEHQVDRHLYHGGKLIAVVECKAYLDACMYVRACSDFKRMKKLHPTIKSFLFALEDSQAAKAKAFTDVDFDNVCDGIFHMCDGKRSSARPLYTRQFAKEIVQAKFVAFVNALKALLPVEEEDALTAALGAMRVE